MNEKIRTFLYKHGYDNSLIQRVWITLMTPFISYNKKKRSKNVNQKGNELLDVLMSLSKKNNVIIWPEFGTLLGAYRNKSFISYDPDIDMGVFAEDFTDTLMVAIEELGVSKHRCMYLVNKGTKEKRLVELTLNYKGLLFDLFLSDRIDSHTRRVYVSYSKISEIDNKYKVKYYTIDYNNDNEKICINGQNLSFPGNVNNYLESIYGKDYMTPIKGWIPPKYNPIMTYLDNNVYFVEEERF